MLQTVDNDVEAHPYKQYAAMGESPATADVILEKDEIYNLIDFIEVEFINAVRKDEEIDNINYIVSMMNVLQKLRLAYASIKLEEEAQNLIRRNTNENCD